METIKRHSVLAYFVTTFVISWGCILLVIGPGGFLGVKEPSEALLPFVYLATLAGPSVAGILLTGLVDGREGFREFASRLCKLRVNIRWYVAAFIIAPLLMTAILLALSLVSPEFLPIIFNTENKVGLLLSGILMGVAVGFFEELGWTGFVTPRLRQRYSVITTGLIIGVLWGLWHLPLFLGSIHSSGIIPPAIYLSVLLFSFLPVYRVLMTWFYHQTGSLFVAVLMHAPLTAGQLIIIPPTISGAALVTYNILFTAALWIVVAIVTMTNGKQHLRQLFQKHAM